jgi:Histidine kinase-like ATPase domain
VLDREFDADALAGLRQAVLGYATACGMPGDRAIDVMLAVHELAANAVRHGPGHGRLRLYVTSSTLHCEVSDPARPAATAAPWCRGRSSKATACGSYEQPATTSA